ncbi:hypothetical protein [Devosia elaeis]|nr:hypothetical protein [Devosia elaeis]
MMKQIGAWLAFILMAAALGLPFGILMTLMPDGLPVLVVSRGAQ